MKSVIAAHSHRDAVLKYTEQQSCIEKEDGGIPPHTEALFLQERGGKEMKNYEFICPSCGAKRLIRNYDGGHLICGKCFVPFGMEKPSRPPPPQVEVGKSISANPSPSLPVAVEEDPEKRISINQLNITTGHSINLAQNVSAGRPGMNLGQLTVLWHAIIIVMAACFLSGESVLAVVGVCIFAAALIYTLKPLPGVEKRKLFKTVALPWGIVVGIVVCFAAFVAYGRNQSIPSSHIQTITLEQQGDNVLMSVTNKSDCRVTSMMCHFVGKDRNDSLVINKTVYGYGSIAAGKEGVFSFYGAPTIFDLKRVESDGGSFSFDISDVKGSILPWEQ